MGSEKRGFTVEYSNKEIYDKIENVEKEIVEMCGEYKRMQEELKKQNGIKKALSEVQGKVDRIEAEGVGKNTVADAILKWGGWLIALGTVYLKMRGGG